jgi:DNA polymerase III subunit epsilon
MPNQPSDLKSFLDAVAAQDFVVLDTETTGLDRTAEICDIAIVNSSYDVLFESFVKTVKPISEEAAEIHGISNSMVANSPSWSRISKDVAHIIKGKKVIAYNATFDRKMFHQSDGANGLPETDWQGDSLWFCAMLAFAERYGEWNDYYGNYKWKKLVEASRFYNCDELNAHRAVSDALMTLNVVKCMYAESLSNGYMSGVPFAGLVRYD